MEIIEFIYQLIKLTPMVNNVISNHKKRGLMKALAVFPASREVKIVDHPEPDCASPTEVKLRILEAGICGTDREIADFRYGTPPAGSPYQIIGHEALGEVIEVGSAVTSLVPGDLAVLMVRRPCPHAHCPALPCRPSGLLHYR